MQDAVRESGGLGAVLELTQMDEHAACESIAISLLCTTDRRRC